jgi:hypothetical protein
MKAFEILPSVHTGYEHDAFERLRALMLITTDLFPAYGPDSTLFLARPAWRADSLVLIPYPARVLAQGSATGIPPGFAEALRRQRAEFRKTAAAWSAAFPRGAGAKQAVAMSLEMLGDPTAVDTLLLARQLAGDSTTKVRLAAAEVLLRVKFGVPTDVRQLQLARALADSLLAIHAPSAEQARALAPVAAIMGRCNQAEQLVRQSERSNRALGVAPHLYASAEALLARVALGCNPGAFRVSDLAEAVSRERAEAGASLPAYVELALLYRPALLAKSLDSAVIDRLAAANDNLLLIAARALTRLDTLLVRRALSDFAAQWRPALGTPTPDIIYPAARFLTSIGDTVRAIEWLDRTLKGLRTYDPRVLADHGTAASLMRAVMMRAELAGETGDEASAGRWGGVMAVLWSSADRELRQDVRRISRFAERR